MSERPGILFATLVAIAGTVFALLLVGLSALGGGGIASLLLTLIGAFSACIFFVAQLRAVPLASLALVTVTLASSLSLLRAIVRYRRQQRLLRALQLEPIVDGQLAEVAHAAGAHELYVARARRPAAFCVGVLRPRIVVTAGLLERLTADEQAAVVWHEAQHARLREPLRCLVAELASSSLFWLPALKDVCERYRLTRELDADRLAITRTSRRALAGALHEAIVQPGYAGTIGLGDSAAARIDRLFDPAAALPPIFRRSRLVLSGFALLTLTALLAFPGHLSLDERARPDSMLMSHSLHGLPGMAAGFGVNTAALIAIAALGRRFARKVKAPV